MNLKSLTPDLILIHGDIHTQDPLVPRASAVAICEGRILAVGDRDAVEPMRQKHTRVVDLGGRLVLPGMTDVHFHGFEWAKNRQHLALADVISFDHLCRKVESWVGRLAPGKWVIGQGWNETDWPEPRIKEKTALKPIPSRR